MSSGWDSFRPTHLIGRHIEATITGLRQFKGHCALCGGLDLLGKSIHEIVTPTFADIDWLNGGKYFCKYCLKCLGHGQPRKLWIKNFSYLATKNRLLFLKREDLWNYLMRPPDDIFVFNITFGHKKHMSFKSRVNHRGRCFWVRSDRDSAFFDLFAMENMIRIIQDWYSFLPQKRGKTYFTKKEILSGIVHTNRILEYGYEKFLAENQELAKWRGTHAFEILVYALNPRERYLDDKN